MKITFEHDKFRLDAVPIEDQLVVLDCDFEFCSPSNAFEGGAESVRRLRQNALKLSTSLTISELALQEFKAAGEKVLTAIEESHAETSDLDIPVPAGLSLLPFQRAGVAYLAKRKYILLSDEMGLGKTPQAICAVNVDRKAHQILVICPASLKINWLREFKRWTTKLFDYQIVEGSEPVQMTRDVVIINYDILHAHREALREMNWDVLIADECHYLKNKRTDRTREVFGGIKRNADKEIIDRVTPINAKRVILITGTPIVNRPKELWPILAAIDSEGLGSDWLHYAKRYCNAFQIEFGGKVKGWKWDGAQNLEELQAIMRSRFMVRRMKKDVLKDLPAKRRQVIVLEPKAQLKKLIAKEAKSYEEHAASLKDKDPLEILTGFEGLSGLRKEIALKKVPYVIEHIQEVLNEQEKVVVFVHHHDVGDAITRAFGDAATQVDGRVSTADRQLRVDCFQSDPTCRVFVGGIQAAGVGLTLTAANVVVFAELSWVPGEVSQAEDRLHRIGQKEQVLVQHIVLAGSLDERMVEVLIAKQEIIDRALNKSEAPCLK